MAIVCEHEAKRRLKQLTTSESRYQRHTAI